MDVRGSAEVPHKGRSFQAPVVPDSIFTDIGVGIKGKVTLLQATLGLQALNDLILVTLSIRCDQFLQCLLHLFALIRGQVAHRNPGAFTTRVLKSNLFLFRRVGHFSQLTLPSIKHFIDLIRLKSLLPKDVPLVFFLFVKHPARIMAVKDWSTKSEMVR